MRSTFVKTLCTLGLLAGATVGQADTVLVQNRQPVARIYHAPLTQEPNPTIRDFTRNMDMPEKGQALLATAIHDLRYHLEQMSGATLELIAIEDPAAIEPPALVIGAPAAALGAEPTAHPEAPEAFRVLTANGNVLIAGHGEYADFGTSHGIYELLYRLGCDWVFPGVEGEVIPRRDTVTVPDLDIQSAPSFTQRHAWYGGMQRDGEAQLEFFQWKQRVKMQQRSILIDSFGTGGHGNTARFHRFHDELDQCIPPAETEIVQEVLEEIRQQFADNDWPNDKVVCIRGYGPGDGGALRRPFTDRMAIDAGRPDGTDLIILFFNTILEELEDEFPNLHLTYLVYSWHSDYPKKYRPHPRIAVEVADLNFSRLQGIGCMSSRQRHYFRNIIDMWGRLHEEQGNILHRYYYGYNVANGYLPISMIKIYGEGIPYEYDLGFTGMRFNLYDNWEVSGANNYVAARLSWDHTQDWRDLLREFCEKSYGAAAGAMERYFLAVAERQSTSGIETGSFFAYPLVYDDAFLDEMDAMLAEAYRRADTDLERTRVAYMQIQPQRLRMYLDMFEAMCDYDFAQAQTLYATMQEKHAADMERNRQFASRMGATFLRIFHERAINEAVAFSSDPYRIVYRIPERLKTSLDRKVMGGLQGYYRREINDDHHFVTSTYRSTWDAQGFAGYRKGAVWYRIPIHLGPETASWWQRLLRREPEAVETDEEQGIGLFIGGGEGMVSVYCNDQFVGRGRASLARSLVFDLTDFIDPDGDNLLALQFDRVGNDELGTGGMIRPSFLFSGPRIDMEDMDQHRPFRILPGGIYEYID